MSTPEEQKYLASAVEVCKEHNILLPTFKMLDNPTLIPEKVKAELEKISTLISPT
jgi:hypothetical protein